MTSNSNTLKFRKELRTIAKANRCELLGILNTTPDSFFDGGKNFSPETAVHAGLQMINDGAFIIDVGGASSRPGADTLSPEDEWQRVKPVIEGILNKNPKAYISIDTYHSLVARNAVKAGAVMINDISAGSIDPEMFQTVAELNVPYVLMHMKGTPINMQDNPTYNNVVKEVHSFFETKLKELKKLGVDDVVLDPGFGFGKTLEDNYTLLNNLDKFSDLGSIILSGVSRKSMIYKALDCTAQEALNGTTALNMISLKNGAQLLRVHDIAKANEVIELHKLLKGQ